MVGWHHSPVGAAELNDAVPDEGEDGTVDPEPCEPVEPTGVQAPLADQVVVESQAEEWAKLWCYNPCAPHAKLEGTEKWVTSLVGRWLTLRRSPET